ncbi:uncharacterized protein LTR77_006579 [Saxophila tyrrhenica]|uniref:Uncharacterized protein n=1 Tax=Saxophila tyrrhenica TaxID=1690608 RepID=A0AAV9P782_9PEZI|nr:hypothetical protein LTR77_006579 [Saxophila tyrrhenica]
MPLASPLAWRPHAILTTKTLISLASKTTTGRQSDMNFTDLDKAANSETSIGAVRSRSTFNFVLDFSDDAARASFDLHPLSVAGLLDTERPDILNTRWINVFRPAQQAPLLELIAKHYDFSPRLLALMSSKPQPNDHSADVAVSTGRSHHSLWRRRGHSPPSKHDVEKGPDELSELSSISSYDSAAFCNLYKVANELWHYSSIDFGRSYVCIGYNSLYGTKCIGEKPGDGLLPHCTRVWTWLILCEDNTIVSISEDPFPYSGDRLSPLQQRILTESRRNIVNIFRAICTDDAAPAGPHMPMAQLPIRSRLGNTPAESAHRPTDVPGLLFYYLFENWQNSYTLITRRESRYGIELKALRDEMFEAPKLCHIDRLDAIGTELGVLKRHYSAYNRIIDRLLEPQTSTTASMQSSRSNTEASQSSLDTVRPLVTEKESMLGVSFSSAARVRFKRLRDLIDLYALSEVEEYIKQKDSLVAMNFNLIAIKESLDVERLTRLTLLLTKITMIFLPVSLMIGYFSVQLSGVEYGLKEFWVSFAVVLFLSGGALFLFGLVSGTVQTFEAFRAVGRGMKRSGRWIKSRL